MRLCMIMSTSQPKMAKVLVVGKCGVGKTSLVYNYIFKGFTEVGPTIGVDLAHKVCVGDAGPVKLGIWDLSGHPRFVSLMPSFCSGAAGIVLVFDLTDPASLSEAAMWLHQVNSSISPSEPCAIVLVGNKMDLSPKIALEVIDDFCLTHEIQHFVSCSAKTGENVRRVFQTLCSSMQRSITPRDTPSQALHTD